MSEVRHEVGRFRTGHAGLSCRLGTSGQWLAANADLGRIDAELLLGHVIDMGRATVIAHPETVLTNGQEERLNRLANRRREREPLAYILGRKESRAQFGRKDVPRPDGLAVEPLAAGARVAARHWTAAVYRDASVNADLRCERSPAAESRRTRATSATFAQRRLTCLAATTARRNPPRRRGRPALRSSTNGRLRRFGRVGGCAEPSNSFCAWLPAPA